MRYGIQTKVTGFLVLVLAVVFGGSTLFGVRATSRIMNEQAEHSQAALHKAARSQALNVFAGLDTGTKGSLERGEMAVFEALLADLSQIEGVLEIGLANPAGKTVYTSVPERLGSALDAAPFAAAVAAGSEVHATDLGDAVLILRAQPMEADCLRCHEDAALGDVAGVLFARYSLQALAAAQEDQAALLGAGQRDAAVSGITAGVIGLVAASLGLSLLIRFLVCAKLDALTRQARELATGEADLTRRLPAGSRDELGEVATAFNAFVENLQHLIRDVMDTSHEVAAGSEEIVEASAVVLRKAGEQSEQTQVVAAATEEMSATVTQVARGTQDASEAARSAAGTAEAGGQVVEEGIAGMLQVEARVKSIAAKVETLGERSRSIGEVMVVIDDIADQTNLLALNAAIEAARAGEHGRGFAVVADEVRKLAEKTAQATRQVSQTVAAIQSETEAAVALVTAGLEEVVRSSGLSKRAGEALREIVSKIESNADMVAQIATASEQQSVTVEEISGHVEGIASLSTEVVSDMERVSGTARSLGEQTERLGQLVSRFRV
ncbi:MAG: methyl-accepting chemotaxis protein [Deferrisomatales bacterium]|nr:methyl-accepting chemotaxis protein [Deferrisomatales bacterium]